MMKSKSELPPQACRKPQIPESLRIDIEQIAYAGVLEIYGKIKPQIKFFQPSDLGGIDVVIRVIADAKDVEKNEVEPLRNKSEWLCTDDQAIIEIEVGLSCGMACLLTDLVKIRSKKGFPLLAEEPLLEEPVLEIFRKKLISSAKSCFHQDEIVYPCAGSTQ